MHEKTAFESTLHRQPGLRNDFVVPQNVSVQSFNATDSTLAVRGSKPFAG
jgi:hypothetical protein